MTSIKASSVLCGLLDALKHMESGGYSPDTKTGLILRAARFAAAESPDWAEIYKQFIDDRNLPRTTAERAYLQVDFTAEQQQQLNVLKKQLYLQLKETGTVSRLQNRFFYTLILYFYYLKLKAEQSAAPGLPEQEKIALLRHFAELLMADKQENHEIIVKIRELLREAVT